MSYPAACASALPSRAPSWSSRAFCLPTRRSATSTRSPPRSCGRRFWRWRAHHVARLDRAYALWGSGIEHVARIERVKGRAPFDQLAAVIDQLAGVAALLELAIDRDGERHVVRIGDLVGSRHPGAEHRVGVY